MVSQDNVLIGIIGIIVASFLTRKNGVSMVESVFRPTVTPLSNAPVDSPQIQMLKDAIAGVQGFIKRTFKAPNLPPSPIEIIMRGGQRIARQTLARKRGQVGCRGPNCLGALGATGVRTAFDPFTGQRLLIGFGPRASPKTRTFFGDPSANLFKVTQGQALFTEANTILAQLKSQLNILQTKSV